jgi:iron(III) transport system permease protein
MGGSRTVKWQRYVLPTIIMVGLVIFVVYPILSVLIESFQWGDQVGLSNFADLFTTAKHAGTIWNSLWMAMAAALIATFLGLVLAIIVFRTSLPLRKLFGVSAVLPIIIPGFILAIGYIYLFGRSGLVTYEWLNLTWDVYSWKSVLVIQVLDFTTMAFMVISAVMMGVNSQLEDAARSMGASEWKVLTTVTLPLIWPGIISAGLLVFLGSMADFSTPLVVGGKFSNLASASYAQMMGAYNPGLSSAMNIILLLICLVVFWLYSRTQSKDAGIRMQLSRAKQKKLALHPAVNAVLWGICFIFSIGVLALLSSVILSAFTKHLGINYSFTLQHFDAVWQNVSVSAVRTIILAMVTSLIVSMVGIVVAYIVTRVRIRGRTTLDLLATLTFAVPGTFIGIGYALGFSHPPLVLSGTWVIIAACVIVRTLPIGVRAGSSTLMQQDYALEEASASLGASKLRTFFRVVVPLARPAMIVTAIYTFVMAVQTVGPIIFLISPDKKLLSVEAFQEVISMRMGQAGAVAAIMLAIGAVGVLAIYFIGSREDIFGWLRKSLNTKTHV